MEIDKILASSLTKSNLKAFKNCDLIIYFSSRLQNPQMTISFTNLMLLCQRSDCATTSRETDNVFPSAFS